MASVKSKILLIYCFLVTVSMTNGQNADTLPVYKTKYQHIVFKIDDKYFNYTDIVSIFRNYNVLAKGFLSMGNDLEHGVYFIDGKNYKHQYYEINNVDTINNNVLCGWNCLKHC